MDTHKNVKYWEGFPASVAELKRDWFSEYGVPTGDPIWAWDAAPYYTRPQNASSRVDLMSEGLASLTFPFLSFYDCRAGGYSDGIVVLRRNTQYCCQHNCT